MYYLRKVTKLLQKKMNVRITKIFGREITVQDEELEMPKYLKIKGVLKEPSW